MRKKAALILTAAALFVCAACLVFQSARYAEHRRLAQTRETELETRITVLAETVASLTDPGNGVRRHGALRVEGAQLVDAQGEPLQLRGMSSHGLTWYPEYINSRSLRSIKERGANVFRAAMYADSVQGGYNDGERNRHFNKSFLYIAVENALDADMYVIADWHMLLDENPMNRVEEAAAFFDELSSRYAGEPGVLYEICNEPNGETTWRDIREYAGRVIPVIRKNSPDAVIIVGTPKYSSDIYSAAAEPLDFENIMYAYHLYTGLSDGHYIQALGTAREKGIPVFVTEWGINTDPSTGLLDTQEAYEFISYMRANKISWTNWSMSHKEEDHAAFRSDTTKISGWTEDELTVSGRIVFEALAE